MYVFLHLSHHPSHRPKTCVTHKYLIHRLYVFVWYGVEWDLPPTSCSANTKAHVSRSVSVRNLIYATARPGPTALPGHTVCDTPSGSARVSSQWSGKHSFAHTHTYLSQTVEAGEQLVEYLHQILGRIGGRDGRETDNICIQNAANESEIEWSRA